jgi:MFS family permease
VKLLGYASLFTDAATEAVYPLLPVFVTRVLGGSPRSLGIIEGAADATASVFKLLAGRWSDRTGRRKPFVLAGYTIAGLVRPLIALAATWHHVFAIRLADRVGKGLRGAPRDAMLDALAPEGQRGRVFGYHRAMDHAGAVLGPLLATLFLYFAPGTYRTLFALTIIPGVLAIVMLRFVPETVGSGRAGRLGQDGNPASAKSPSETNQPYQTHPTNQTYPPDQTHQTYQTDPTYPTHQTYQATPLPQPLKRFLMILAVFTLGNSSDAFLLLRLSDAGLATSLLPMAWAGLHVVKSGLSTYGGALSDRFGRHRLIIIAWLLYAVVYAGFAVTTRLIPLLAWFLIYGVYFALAEGSEKALIADLMQDSSSQGTAFGWYNAVLGFGALAASLLFGFLWESFGPSAAFYTGAALAITASALLAAERSIASPS